MGRLIEEITGQSLYEFLSENIFKPLEMNDTQFQLPLNKTNRFIPVYAYDEQENLLKEMREWNYMRFMMKNRESGGGGLISTTSDYINFWLNNSEDGIRQYSFWIADATLAFNSIHRNDSILSKQLGPLIKNYNEWENTRKDNDKSDQI